MRVPNNQKNPLSIEKVEEMIRAITLELEGELDLSAQSEDNDEAVNAAQGSEYENALIKEVKAQLRDTNLGAERRQ